jgi:hypothetical protein
MVRICINSPKLKVTCRGLQMFNHEDYFNLISFMMTIKKLS